MNAPREEKKLTFDPANVTYEVLELDNSDQWFLNTLKALISGQEALTLLGKQKEIDRAGIAKWITNNL